MRVPYRDKGRTLCKAASLEYHDLRNQMLFDQNVTGRVAQVHKVLASHVGHTVAVQKFRGLLHQAVRYGR